MKDNPAATWAISWDARVSRLERSLRIVVKSVQGKLPGRDALNLSNIGPEGHAAAGRIRDSVHGWVGRMKDATPNPKDWPGWKLQPEFKLDFSKVTNSFDAAKQEVNSALKVWAETMGEHVNRIKMLPAQGPGNNPVQGFDPAVLQAMVTKFGNDAKTWSVGVQTKIQTWKPGKLHIDLDIITPTGEAIWELVTDVWWRLPPTVRHLLPYVATASVVGLASHIIHMNYFSPPQPKPACITSAGQTFDLTGHPSSKCSPVALETNFLLPSADMQGSEHPGFAPTSSLPTSFDPLTPAQPGHIIPAMMNTATSAEELAQRVAQLTGQLQQVTGQPNMSGIPSREEALQVALLASLVASQAAVSAAHLAAYSVACASAAYSQHAHQVTPQPTQPVLQTPAVLPHLTELHEQPPSNPAPPVGTSP